MFFMSGIENSQENGRVKLIKHNWFLREMKCFTNGKPETVQLEGTRTLGVGLLITEMSSRTPSHLDSLPLVVTRGYER